jgi:hypothetical protein
MTVEGRGFNAASRVHFDDRFVYTPVERSDTQLQIRLINFDHAIGGMRNVWVSNPAPGGGESARVPIAFWSPRPELDSLSPDSAFVNERGTVLLMGRGFSRGMEALVAGRRAFLTTYDGSRAVIEVSGAAAAAVGTVPVILTAPTPGGGASTVRTIRVVSRAP